MKRRTPSRAWIVLGVDRPFQMSLDEVLLRDDLIKRPGYAEIARLSEVIERLLAPHEEQLQRQIDARLGPPRRPGRPR